MGFNILLFIEDRGKKMKTRVKLYLMFKNNYYVDFWKYIKIVICRFGSRKFDCIGRKNINWIKNNINWIINNIINFMDNLLGIRLGEVFYEILGSSVFAFQCWFYSIFVRDFIGILGLGILTCECVSQIWSEIQCKLKNV